VSLGIPHRRSVQNVDKVHFALIVALHVFEPIVGRNLSLSIRVPLSGKTCLILQAQLFSCYGVVREVSVCAFPANVP